MGFPAGGFERLVLGLIPGAVAKRGKLLPSALTGVGPGSLLQSQKSSPQAPQALATPLFDPKRKNALFSLFNRIGG